jgi:hypothetical protein
MGWVFFFFSILSLERPSQTPKIRKWQCWPSVASSMVLNLMLVLWKEMSKWQEPKPKPFGFDTPNKGTSNVEITHLCIMHGVHTSVDLKH